MMKKEEPSAENKMSVSSWVTGIKLKLIIRNEEE
jgi:hypothetical protein